MKKTSTLSNALLLLAILCWSPISFATTYMVINTNDAGAGSLRQAIIDAVPGDTVHFDPMLIAAGSDTINLLTEISITENIVIEGFYTSYDTLYISGQGACRIFNINVSSGTLVLRGLCVVDGYANNGGAITNSGAGEVMIDSCVFMNNYATNGGGVLYKISGDFSVFNTTFKDNYAIADGGAFNLFAVSSCILSNCTFSDNLSELDGGGIYGFGTTTILTINCTFSGNESGGDGGGIWLEGSSAVLFLINTTIADNTAVGAGGVYFFGSSIQFAIGSSIIAANNGSPDLTIFGAGATSISFGYNVLADAAMMGSVPTDQLSVTPSMVDLGPLQDNGGTRFTMMPNVGSVAIDMGEPTDLSTAQNGIVVDGIRDAGAAERFTCPVTYSGYFDGACGDYTVPSGDETYTGTGVIFVTDTILNACGEDSIMNIIVIFDDIDAPVPDIASLTDITDQCEVTLTAPTATDACAGAITGTTGTTFPITALGLTVVTWTYDDGAGNISTQDQNVTISGLDLTVSVSGVTLTSNSSGSTYQWVDCNQSFNAIPGETNQDFAATSNGSYAVVVTNGACSDTSACFDVSGIGINEEFSSSLLIYPNPSSGSFRILSSEYGDLWVSIYSADGKRIVSDLLLTEENPEINLSSAEAGIYFVAVKNNGSQEVIRLVLE